MPKLEDQQPRGGDWDFRRQLGITFGNGRSIQSGWVDLNRKCETVVAISMPAAWTAADLTVQSMPPLGDPAVDTWQNVYDQDGNEVTIQAAAAILITITPSLLSGLRYLRFRSGTSGTPVNQGAKRTLMLITRPV